MIIIYIFGIASTYWIIKLILIPCLISLKHGFSDGWNGTKTYKSLYFPDEPEKDNTDIEDQIAHYETMIERNKERSLFYEKQLEYEKNMEKRSRLLAKLNMIDDQTFRYMQRINKLLEKLE